MGNDTNAGFRAGIEAAAQAAYKWWDGEPEDAEDLRAHIRSLTPTASEATAIGAGGMVTLPRRAAQALLDDLNARIDQAHLTAVPVFAGIVELHDALAASPKVASDTAPGVDPLYTFFEQVSAPSDWDGSWAMACSSLWAKWSLAALSASPADASSDAGGVER